MNKAVSFGREVPGEQLPEAGGGVLYGTHSTTLLIVDLPSPHLYAAVLVLSER
jgi:hypothetical protein